MHLVDYIHFMFSLCRSENRTVYDASDIVNSSVAGGVHFHNVLKASVLCRNTVFALAAGVSVFRRKAVYSLCQNLGTGGFTGTTGACKQICVVYSSGFQFVYKGGCYMLLTRNIIKCFCSPFSIQNLIQSTHPRNKSKMQAFAKHLSFWGSPARRRINK